MTAAGPGVAVVTGASGFVGSHLVDALVARGWRVRRLVRAASPRAADAPGVETHVVDYDDARTLDRTLDRAPALDGADVLFHVAGVTKRLTLDAFRAGNVRPARALLDALARRGARPRVVLVSSQAAAGPAPAPDAPITEDDAPRPVEAYGRSKLEAEDVVRAADVPWTIVRPSAVYGPRDVDFLTAFRHARHGLAVYPAPRGARLSLVYVADLVALLVRAAETPAAVGRTYFAAAHDAAWRDVYAAAAATAGTRLRLEIVPPAWTLRLSGRLGALYGRATGTHPLVNPHKVTLGLQPWWLCSAERARRELGWTPALDLAEGARRTAAWYRGAGWM